MYTDILVVGYVKLITIFTAMCILCVLLSSYCTAL